VTSQLRALPTSPALAARLTLADSDLARARTEPHGILGDVLVTIDADEFRLETKKGAVEGALLRSAVGQQVNVVAGAGFGNYLPPSPAGTTDNTS